MLKKITALLMALVLVFAMTACSKEPAKTPDILGTYETTLDFTDYVVTEYDEESGITLDGFSIGDYMDGFHLTLVTEFYKDGTYAQYIDEASVEAAISNLENAVLPMLDDFILSNLIIDIATYGYDVETREEVEELLEMDWETIVSSVLEVTPEDLVSITTKDIAKTIKNTQMTCTGRYLAEEGKLYMSETIEETIDEACYETYEINGDVVTITGGVNVEAGEFLSYPFTLTKVS